jgi:protein gp37
MYGFVTHTWNPIKGKCSHDCIYCYMKAFPQKQLRLVEKELKEDLGHDNFIFVGSSTDMFAIDVPDGWIIKVIQYCSKFKNRYLFQSKNTGRMAQFLYIMPPNCVFATTIETNRDNYVLGKAPNIYDRVNYFAGFPEERMITLEPLCDFDLDELMGIVLRCNPKWVNIGADSKKHNLPEPSKEKIEALITELKKVTEVRIKPNLNRLID